MGHFDEHYTAAQEIQRKYRADRAAIQGDKDLSPEGKHKRLTELEQRRQQDVADLQTRAHDILNGRRVTLTKAARQEAEQRIESRRKLLGDMLLADIYCRQLEASEPRQIEQMYESAATDWERAVIAGYGVPILEMQLRAGPNGDAMVALDALTTGMAQSTPEGTATQELADVENALQRIEAGELDRESYNNMVADRYGVDARFIEA